MSKKTMDDLFKKSEARVYGRFIFLKLINGVGAPIIDKAKGMLDGGRSWRGWAIQINPFRFEKDGRRKEGECFVVGIIHK